MLRPQLRTRAPSYNKLHRRLMRRLFGSSPFQSQILQTLPPVRVLGPTLWCLTAASAVYLGCAAYEVHQDAQKLKRYLPPGAKISYAELQAIKATNLIRGLYSKLSGGGPPTSRDPGSLAALWENQSSIGKLAIGAIGLNASIYAACRAAPSLWDHFAHAAAGPSNYTLFTSMFGHAGTLHLGFNMYALYNFAPPVAESKTFGKSASHLTAFYLSTGILSSLAQHLSGVWPNPAGRLIPSLGASGAIMALLGAFGMSYPNAEIGFIFLPVSFPAQQALAGIALVEAYGLFIGKWMRLGHAAHLAGLAMGSAYVYYGGNIYLWEPTRRFAFNQMRRLKMV